MPKYYCDYCDIFLTHDSASVRKAHNSGWKHINQVAAYYRDLEPEKTQEIINQLAKAYNGLPMPVMVPPSRPPMNDYGRRHNNQAPYGDRGGNSRYSQSGPRRNHSAGRNRSSGYGDRSRGPPNTGGRGYRPYEQPPHGPPPMPPNMRFPPPGGPPPPPGGGALGAPPQIHDRQSRSYRR
ncbi:U1 small nuclear ribonucleoprotein C [Coemansia brasiliensis]|uniref:U1 small nuclear ribonucleoprotein C n=1 Tax=Coemansia brasiliensis TaxID=2650707 RepID=A0A9W8IB28_9FUNG|nr:U1 small nuclear ribonucleoprotein C [Coemansia brasiliensis]